MSTTFWTVFDLATYDFIEIEINELEISNLKNSCEYPKVKLKMEKKWLKENINKLYEQN